MNKIDPRLLAPIGIFAVGQAVVIAGALQTIVAGDRTTRYTRISALATNSDSIFLQFVDGINLGVAAPQGIIELPPGGDSGELNWGGTIQAYTVAGGTVNFLTVLNRTGT